MNALQSFMGCMYPGSIRTESIESLDNDPSCRYQVSNIDEKANEISRGEIQLTDKDMIYFMPGKFPIRWPIGCIRRYGCTEGGEIFTFETGRKSPTGEAIYAFHLANGLDLLNRLKIKIEKRSSQESNENETNIHSRLSFTRNCFTVDSRQQSSIDPYKKPEIINEASRSLKAHLSRKSSHNDTNMAKIYNKHEEQTTEIHNEQPHVSTYTDIHTIIMGSPNSPKGKTVDIKPLPYSNINANVTQSLNELAKAHAANRQR